MFDTTEEYTDRIRTSGVKCKEDTASIIAYRASTGEPYFARSIGYYVGASAQWMADKYEPYGNGIWRFKPVKHVKEQFSNTSVVPVNGIFGAYPCVAPIRWEGEEEIFHFLPQHVKDFTWFRADKENFSSPTIYNTGADWSVVSDEDLKKLQSRFEQRLPRLSDSTDLSVSLKEIKDVARLHKFAADKHRNLLSRAAEGLLSYQYGMKQIAQDLVGLVDGWSHVAYTLQGIMDGANKVHTTNANVRHIESEERIVYAGCPYTEFNGGSWPGSDYCGKGEIVTVDRTGYKIAVCAKYKYHLPDFGYEIINDTIRALSSFQLLPDLRSLWDMIPYSFVVDWFVNTNKWFSKWRNFTQPYDFQVDIVDMTTSLKLFSEKEVYTSCPVRGGSNRLIYSESRSSFIREVGYDSFYNRLPWFTWPGYYNLLIGLALGFMRLPRSLHSQSISKQIKKIHKKLGR